MLSHIIVFVLGLCGGGAIMYLWRKKIENALLKAKEEVEELLDDLKDKD